MNTKMKALSLALMAISGLALAGTAAADCPAGPTVAEGGAWSGKQTTFGSLSIESGGYKGTECRLDATLTGNLGSASAFVRDDTPSNESRYRAQFTVNLDNLAGLNSAQPVRVFSAMTENPSNSAPEIVRVSVTGNAAGSTKIINFSTVCESHFSGYCSAGYPLGGASGEITIEIDWEKSATGGVKFWVNNADESSPTGSIAADNSAWGGVDAAYLGLAGASQGFRAAQLNRAVGFDEFDSRRVSFIGN